MITQDRVRELFSYEMGKLYWRRPPGSKMKCGDRAGSKYWERPYWQVMIDRKVYLEHRLIFLFFYGYLPKEIDHINDKLTDEGIKNNYISNLQEITRGKNIQKSAKTWGVSKYRGVCWHNRHKKWYAQIAINGKSKYCGAFDTEEEAARVYDKAAKELYGDSCFVNFKK